MVAIGVCVDTDLGLAEAALDVGHERPPPERKSLDEVVTIHGQLRPAVPPGLSDTLGCHAEPERRDDAVPAVSDQKNAAMPPASSRAEIS